MTNFRGLRAVCFFFFTTLFCRSLRAWLFFTIVINGKGESLCVKKSTREIYELWDLYEKKKKKPKQLWTAHLFCKFFGFTYQPRKSVGEKITSVSGTRDLSFFLHLVEIRDTEAAAARACKVFISSLTCCCSCDPTCMSRRSVAINLTDMSNATGNFYFRPAGEEDSGRERQWCSRRVFVLCTVW